jgi:hypothetical protein
MILAAATNVIFATSAFVPLAMDLRYLARFPGTSRL